MPAARLVDDLGTPASAAEQMAADATMLADVAAGGPPILRLYTWARPALTVGRFQPERDVDADACARHAIEVARRPSGGRALLHGGDLTYALALRRVLEPVTTTYRWIAGGLVAALRELGVDTAVAEHGGRPGPACFSACAGADLRVGERKVCGSAQVRRGHAILQHGSVLLRRLAVDESDLTRGVRRGALRRATVTLEELGATTQPIAVAAAFVQGFSTTLDLDFTSRASLPAVEVGRSLRG